MASPSPPAKRPCVGNETLVLSSVLHILAQTGSIGAREAGRIDSTSTATTCDEDVWEGLCHSRWTDTCILSSRIEYSSAGYRASFRHRALNELVLLELPWTVKYRALKRFHSEHGHCNVPRRVGENQELARWLQAEREQYRLYLQGEETDMTQEKIRKLEVLGVEWNILSAAWTQRYHELQEFRYSYGHTRVPRQWEENRQLGHWVTNQRVQYRRFQEGLRSSLTEERISRLEGIGFVWNVLRLV